MTSEELIIEYVDKGKSCPEIARQIGRPIRTVHSWLVRYGIPRRDNTKPGNKIDMTGKKVGMLRVVGQTERSKSNQATWTVECLHCHTMFDLPGWKIRHRQIGGCKKCGKHPNFRGYGDIGKRYWSCLQKNAVDRTLEFTVTIEEAWNLYLKQNRKCTLSGISIFFGRERDKTASLDRIDSTRGYVPGNIQWVHKDINKLKGKLTDNRFVELCHVVSEYQRSICH